MKLPAYSRTKPSGVEWLGDVPEDWSVLPFTKYVSEKSDYRGKTPDKQPDGIFLVTARNVRMGFIDYETSREFIAEEDYDEVMRRGLPKKGDILFTTEAPLGNVAIVDREDIALAQRVIRFRMSPSRYDSKFALFAMMSDHFQHQLKALSTGSTAEGLKASKLPILRLITPTVAEQVDIAAFLDRETGRVDRLVAKKRELIERLKEKRTALISRTVTRGLPPAAARAAGLPVNPPLKPSALDWLGDIPKHWETMMLKRTWAICEYGISESLSGEGSVRVLTMGNIQDGRVLIPSEGCLDDVPIKMLLRDGDLLFNRTNSMAHVGKVGIFRPHSDAPVTFASYLVRLRTNDRATPEFMNYLLNTSQVLELGRSLALPSINQANLNPTRYGQISIPLPPLPEQAAIAAYLDEETAKLDALVGKVEEAVERLQEYRTALITAAVTGKIDVRKEVAS